MSKYKEITTEFRNAGSLKKALSEIGITPELAPDIKESTLHLIGYHGDTRPETAGIVIRRKDVNRFSGGASNDIGFAWNGSTFAGIVSDFDSRASKGLMDKITQTYAKHEIRRQATAQGYTFRETVDNNGVIQMTLSRRR